jgi:hypothetical protein
MVKKTNKNFELHFSVFTSVSQHLQTPFVFEHCVYQGLTRQTYRRRKHFWKSWAEADFIIFAQHMHLLYTVVYEKGQRPLLTYQP